MYNNDLDNKVSKSGDTMIGNLNIQKSNPGAFWFDMNGDVERRIVWAGMANSGGDFYVWDSTNNKSIIYSPADGNDVYFNGSSFTWKTLGTNVTSLELPAGYNEIEIVVDGTKCARFTKSYVDSVSVLDIGCNSNIAVNSANERYFIVDTYKVNKAGNVISTPRYERAQIAQVGSTITVGNGVVTFNKTMTIRYR